MVIIQFEIWLNETAIAYDGNGNIIIGPDGNPAEYPVNQWYGLGREYGYTDHFTEYTDVNTGVTTQDWIWKDEDGNQVASSDLDFRERIMPGLMNRFNGEAWDLLDPWMEIAPIVGVDFYHYKRDFWLHALRKLHFTLSQIYSWRRKNLVTLIEIIGVKVD